MSKRIIFFGNERLATGVSTNAPIFKALIKAGYQIEALIISLSPTKSLDDEPIARTAKENGIKILNFNNLKDAASEISQFGVETAILAAYGKIVPQSVLDVFKNGIINIHPSLLPKHRGPTPLESVILNGEKQTGVSIMKLVREMDAGPIYVQKTLDLSGTETKQELADNLGKLGSELIIDNIDAIINGQLTPKHQDESLATYDKLISKTDGIINWSQSAERIINQIRAYQHWPRSSTKIGDIDLVVIKAHKEESSGTAGKVYLENKQFGIYAGGGVVIIDSLIPKGKKEMSAESFLAGYKTKLVH